MIAHLGLIMDGNRRWAKNRQMFPWLGHKQGAKVVEVVIQYCIDQKIPYLSLYTFSIENFKRSQQEVSYLFSLIEQAQDRVSEFVKSGVKVLFVGDKTLLPQSTRQTCEKIEMMTSGGTALQCHFLLSYGSRQEILAAAQSLVQNCSQNIISMDEFKDHLWSKNIPDLDLIVRTGGVKRLSNFLLFQAAYAEIRFLDCLWPDLTREMLDEQVQDCLMAQKNFGA